MGASFYASVMAGLRLPKKHLFVKEMLPTCDHTIPADAKFCPECGKPASKPKFAPIDGFNGDDRFSGLDVATIMGVGDLEIDEVVIGVEVMDTNFDTWNNNDPSDSTTLGDIEEAQNLSAGILAGLPSSIADRGKFGIWLVPNCG